MADVIIHGSVGLGGANIPKEVKAVQELLNNVPPAWGGPDPKLVPDGVAGSRTRAAILAFQNFQLGTMIHSDSRVDPKQKTLARLNAIANTSEKPDHSFFVTAGAFPHTEQPTDKVCWAASGTMLVNARDRTNVEIHDVMDVADTNDPGGNYFNNYLDNKALLPNNVERYTRSIKLRTQSPISFTVAGWAGLMRAKGALGVVGLTPILHIRVAREMSGDGSVFGTRVTVSDPLFKKPYTEVFMSFVQRYEAAAPAGGVGYFQIWHR